MRSTCCKAFILAMLLAGLGLSHARAGSILRVFYDGIPGTEISNLLNATNAAGQKVFPNGPNVDGTALQSEWIKSYYDADGVTLRGVFEGVPASGDPPKDYGSWIRGFVQAPTTGAYTFWIASDDSSELWLSSDANPANKQKIASVTGWTSSREWTKYASQKSAAINLNAGQSYYIEVLHKEGTGGDNVAVGWTLPSGTNQRPIPAVYLQPYPSSFFSIPSLITEPKDFNVQENTPVVFYVDVNGTPTSYQWYTGKTPEAINPIAGANMAAYTLTPKLTDDQTFYRVIVGTKEGLVVSRSANLRVGVDTVKPTISAASSDVFGPDQVKVTFSEAVSAESAGDVGNYAIDKGVMVYAASVTGANTVLLYTSRLNPRVDYTLTVNDVYDLSSVPNAIVANSTKTFSFIAPIEFKMYEPVCGTSTNDIMNNADYMAGNYTRSMNVTALESGENLADNYIGQLQAFLLPPTTGNYTFYIAADDGCALFLSTDENPANKVMIAGHNSWTSRREYKKAGAEFANQKSAPVALEAGKRYYVEAVVKEGSGGDHISVAWVKPGDADVSNGGAAIPNQFLDMYRTLGSVVVTNQPKNLTVMENNLATFSVGRNGVQGTPPFTYQWYKNGLPIADATNHTYTYRTTWADQNAAFTVLVRNNFSLAASANAVLTLTADNVKPTAVASGLYSNLVTVAFSEAVNATEAVNLANYTLKSEDGNTTITITNAAMVDAQTVNLGIPTLRTGDRYKLTVKNINDLAKTPNKMADATLLVGIYNFQEIARINNSQAYGLTVGEKVKLQAGGDDIWNNADGFAFAYQQLTGDFDYRLRIHSLTQADWWTKVGLMARVSTAAGSRNVSMLATPTGGQNRYQFQFRDVADQGSGSSGPTPNVSYPNTWVRLVRVGSVFYAYYSADGLNWQFIDKKDTATSSQGAFPATILVGAAATAHNSCPTASTVAEISDFGNIVPLPLEFSAVIPDINVLETRTATFSALVKGTDPYFYQWQKQAPGTSTWVDIAGATAFRYTTPMMRMADDGTKYRCVVRNLHQSVTSNEILVTVVKDNEPPAIATSAVLWGGKFLAMQFTEPLDAASAQTIANYTISGVGVPYRGSITKAELRPNGTVVVLSLNLPVVTNMQVIAKSVLDLPGNGSNSTNISDIVRLTSRDIGTFDPFLGQLIDPIAAGATYPTSPLDFEVLAGGSGLQGTNDGFHYVYTEAAGNFDIKVRVESLKLVAANSQAGLMVREDSNPGSRNLNIVVTPTDGANNWQVNYRSATNQAGAKLPDSSTPSPVPYPNGWVRIIRQGNTFSALRSVDGIVWERIGIMIPNPPYPGTVLVGLATTASNNTTERAEAQYREFSLGPVATPPTLVALVGQPTLNRVTAEFSGPVDRASATKPGNYTLDGGLTVSAAYADESGKRVTLVTSMQTPGVVYTLTVNNVLAADGTPLIAGGRLAFSAFINAQGFLAREIWNGIPAPLDNLKASARYPHNPDALEYLTAFESPSNSGENYSQKVFGFFTPLVDGDYRFYIAADSKAELYLSTDNNPANKALIATVATGTGPREWTKEANQKSAVKSLQAGKAYYIEALSATGYGADHMAVTWTGPDKSDPPANGTMPISASYLSSTANPDTAFIRILAHPKDATTVKNQRVSFSADAAAAFQPVIFYQWQIKLAGTSTPWMDFPDATSKTWQTPRTKLSENGAKVRARISVPGKVLYTTEATLTVFDDTIAPTVVSATSVLNSSKITIVFSEAMEPETANVPQNFVLFGGWDVIESALQSDGKTIVLTTDRPITKSIVVWVWNATDLAGNVCDQMLATQIISLTAASVTTVESAMPMSIKQVGEDVVISWPAAAGEGLTLEAADSLTSPWNNVSQPVALQDGENTVVMPATGQMKVYRLKQKGETTNQ